MTTVSVGTAVEAALFDLDGTLLDTPRAISEQLVTAVYEVTGRAPQLSAAQELIGRPLPELCAQLAGLASDAPEILVIIDAYRELYRTKVVPSAASLIFPGVEKGLDQLKQDGVKLAVVTSKQSDSARLILEASGLGSYFSAVVGVDDTELPKPHPHPALLALERLGVGPWDAVMVGDTVHDMGTAHAVPMRSLAVTYGVGTEAALRATDPSGIAADFDTVINLILTPTSLERRLY